MTSSRRVVLLYLSSLSLARGIDRRLGRRLGRRRVLREIRAETPPASTRPASFDAPAMKVTALSLWKHNGDDADPHALGHACDVAEFGFFQRASVREMLIFISRTVAKRTPIGARQSVEQDAYMVHVSNKGGLVAVAVMDREYPSRSAFCVLAKMMDEYETRAFGANWRATTADSDASAEMLEEMLVKFQDPSAADKILKIQRELDDTKVVLHKTIDGVLARGEKLDNLVDKSTDLSLASQMFYKQAKKQNQCCTMM